jgi:division protein 1
MIRGGLVDEDLGFEKIGLKKLGDRARGLLTEIGEEDENELGVGRKSKKKRKDRQGRNRSNSLQGKMHLEDLVQQADEITKDKENLQVRTVSMGSISSGDDGTMMSEVADDIVTHTC